MLSLWILTTVLYVGPQAHFRQTFSSYQNTHRREVTGTIGVATYLHFNIQILRVIMHFYNMPLYYRIIYI